jgi:hypothetical protein
MPGTSGSRRRTAVVARAARLAGHLLVAAVCLEVAARLDDRLTYRAPLWARYDADGLWTHDADGLVRNEPRARFEKWRINSLGFRGDELPVEKPAGRIRIACLGTSETFGLYERQGGEWPARLEVLLRRRHPGTEAFNASVVGLRPDTRQPYFDRYVLPLRPDVLVVYPNVLSDATYRAPDPARGGAGALPGAPAAAPAWDRLPRSRVLPKLARALKAAVPEALWRSVRAWRLARTVRRAELTTLGGRPPLDVVPAEAVPAFERRLTALVLAERARGVAPVLATYPTLGTVANRERHRLEFLSLRAWNVELSDLGLIDAATRLNDAVRRVARELAVPLADVDAALPKTSAYFADYVHYTDAGAERVAAIVLDALERARVLDRAPAVTAGAAIPAR